MLAADSSMLKELHGIGKEQHRQSGNYSRLGPASRRLGPENKKLKAAGVLINNRPW